MKSSTDSLKSLLFMSVSALLASHIAWADQIDSPTAPPQQAPTVDGPTSERTPQDTHDMSHTQHQNMPGMPQSTASPPNDETRAPQMTLRRPAASEGMQAPPMPGLDMADDESQHRIWLENLEGVTGHDNGGAWDGQAWFGPDFDKLWLKSEGAYLGDRTEGAKVEALWAHAIRPFWDTQLGVRQDIGGGPGRTWAALGVQGITPYWFDTEITAYVGEAGRTAGRLKVEYDLYLTQRWVLKPEVELNLYGRPDTAREIGSGLSDGQFELRLRYEFTRAFAPYVGFVYDRKFAGSARLAEANDHPAVDHRAVAGLQFFF